MTSLANCVLRTSVFAHACAKQEKNLKNYLWCCKDTQAIYFLGYFLFIFQPKANNEEHKDV